MSQQRVLRRSQVVAKIGLSATSIYNLERAGEFPRHWMQTPRCAVWDEAEVDRWVQGRRAQPAVAAKAPDPALRSQRKGRGKAQARA